MSGRVGCSWCDGDGFVPTDELSAVSALNEHGELIAPCPLCVSKDRMMYGNAFIHDGVRIDPHTVAPQEQPHV